MSYAVLFSNNPKPQYYVASSAMHAVSIAKTLDGNVYGKVIAVMANRSSFRSV